MKILPFAMLLVAMSVNAQQYERYDRPRSEDTRQDDDRRYGGEDIQLSCFGQAENTRFENRSGVEWNPSTHKYEQKSEVVSGKHDFDTTLNISIHDDRGRIRIPKQLIPPMHSGGTGDGWWDIEELIVGHNEIRGRFRLNALNRPTLNIDRRSGSITVEGMIAFNGRCEMDSGHRRF
jgi:hypothetical protein